MQRYWWNSYSYLNKHLTRWSAPTWLLNFSWIQYSWSAFSTYHNKIRTFWSLTQIWFGICIPKLNSYAIQIFRFLVKIQIRTQIFEHAINQIWHNKTNFGSSLTDWHPYSRLATWCSMWQTAGFFFHCYNIYILYNKGQVLPPPDSSDLDPAPLVWIRLWNTVL